MKTKILAILIAAVTFLAGTAVTSCQKVEPTALNVDSLQYKSPLKGVVSCSILYSDASTAITTLDKAAVVVTIKEITAEVDKDGNPIEKMVTSVSATTKNGGQYYINLPLASGVDYHLYVSASTEAETYNAKTKSMETALFKKSDSSLQGMLAGTESVLNLTLDQKGFVSTLDK